MVILIFIAKITSNLVSINMKVYDINICGHKQTIEEAKHGEYSILVLCRTAWLRNVRTWFDFAREIQSTLSHLNRII